MLVLGRFFTFRVSIQEGHRVVATGPYRFVRHPGYTESALLRAMPSPADARRRPLAGILVRIRVEERALNRALGDAYVSYARGKARLIPGIW